MGQIIKLIINDKKTGKSYKTENHNNNPKKDDFHRDVKKYIIGCLKKSIIEKYGKNGNIEVYDGRIIYISQKFNKDTGKRLKTSIDTHMDVEEFFQEITMFIVRYSYEISLEIDINLTIKFMKNSNRKFEIFVSRNKILLFNY